MTFKKLADSLSPTRVGVLGFLIICIVHGFYVWFLAVDVPMWDQWDAEAEWYKRIVDGSFDFSSLVAPHNEHRIAFTRFFNGLIFKLLGGWSPLFLIYAQIPLIAIAVGFLCAWSFKFAGNRNFLAVAFTLLAFTAPYSWANILSAFQNQFYFMILLGLLLIYLAAISERRWVLMGTAVSSFILPCTMAGGIGVLAVLMGVLILRILKAREGRLIPIFALLIVAGAFVLHAMNMVRVPGHAPLHAQNLTEFIIAFAKLLGWPEFPIGFLLWAVIIIHIGRWLYRLESFKRMFRDLSPQQRFSLALIAWCAFNAAATAYARVHADLTSARYQQSFALIVPTFFITIASFNVLDLKPRIFHVGSILLFVGLAIKTGKELPHMSASVADTRFARAAIAEAVKQDNFALLKAKDRDGKVGYFNAERIWGQIMDPRLRDRHLWLGGASSK